MTHRLALFTLQILLSCLATTARAEMVPDEDEPGIALRVPAHGPATRLRLVAELGGPTVECVAPCQLRIATGNYTAVVEGTEPSSFAFRVEPTREALQLVYPRRARGRAAVVLIAIGAGLMAAALTGLAVWGLTCSPSQRCDGTANAVGAVSSLATTYVGGFGMLIGVILKLSARGGIRVAPAGNG